MNRTSKNADKETIRMTAIEHALLLVLIAFSIIYGAVFMMGQYCVNVFIMQAGKAVQEASLSGDASAVDYNSAIHYIELVQQAYNQSNASNVTSIIYGFVTAIITAFGARMLRMGAEERDKLRNTAEEIEGEIKTQVETATNRIGDNLRKMDKATKSSFTQHNNVYIATTSCRNAAHTCTLLQSHIALLSLQNNGSIVLEDHHIIEDLQVDFIRSLTTFRNFLYASCKQEQVLTPETLNVLKHSWNLAKNSLRTYTGADGTPNIDLVRKVFPADADTLLDLYREIEDCFKKLK